MTNPLNHLQSTGPIVGDGKAGEVRLVRVVPIVPDLKGSDMDDWFRSLSTSRLKQMWDDETFAIYCDEIHMAMHERGEGSYVAV